MSFQVSFSNIATEQFVLQHSASRLKTAAEGAVATYVWGDGGGDYAQVNGGGFNTQEQQDELSSDVDQVIGLTELSRVTRTKRITQEGKPENYLDVEYCVTLLCQSDRDQKMYRFFLNPPD